MFRDLEDEQTPYSFERDRFSQNPFSRDRIARALWDHWWRDERDVGDRVWNHPDWAKMRALREAEADAIIAACGNALTEES